MGLKKSFLLFLLSQVLDGIFINESQLAKCGLLINISSPVYLKVRLKALASVVVLFLISFRINSEGNRTI